MTTELALIDKSVSTGYSVPGRADERLHTILSFDVEDHHSIEAATGLDVGADLRRHYQGRIEPVTRWLLDQLSSRQIRATFFIVGEIARRSPALIRTIHEQGHEVASHSWDHRRVHSHTAASFRDDVRKSKDQLEQVIGASVVGYRAPTFSIDHRTAWALDALAECGMLYDSSIYPVRHDRYGVPGAPRGPFLAAGPSRTVLELPPLTLRFLGMSLPAGGGGYFRLFPLFLMRWALRQVRRECDPPVAMIYFHPWEFDVAQPRLPLKWASRFRTYGGIGRTRERLQRLMKGLRFCRAIDVVQQLASPKTPLTSFSIASL